MDSYWRHHDEEIIEDDHSSSTSSASKSLNSYLYTPDDNSNVSIDDDPPSLPPQQQQELDENDIKWEILCGRNCQIKYDAGTKWCNITCNNTHNTEKHNICLNSVPVRSGKWAYEVKFKGKFDRLICGWTSLDGKSELINGVRVGNDRKGYSFGYEFFQNVINHAQNTDRCQHKTNIETEHVLGVCIDFTDSKARFYIDGILLERSFERLKLRSYYVPAITVEFRKDVEVTCSLRVCQLLHNYGDYLSICDSFKAIDIEEESVIEAKLLNDSQNVYTHYKPLLSKFWQDLAEYKDADRNPSVNQISPDKLNDEDHPNDLEGSKYEIIKRYIEALKMTEATESERIRKSEVMSRLFSDFSDIATKYSELIVSEMNIPDHLKTLKPVSVGGVAGGDKFIVNSVLLKVSRDVDLGDGKFLYGFQSSKTEYAMKGASHELIGATQYSKVFKSGVIVPALQTLVDYQGYRIVAIPLLPIKGNETLVYGSADGAKTIKTGTKEIIPELKEAANALHLSLHRIKDMVLLTAGDVEIHLGTDNVYYMIDLARCFPPENPMLVSSQNEGMATLPTSIYFRMLRPEFLRHLRKIGFPALSSDALSGWGAQDKFIHNPLNMIATEYLLKVQIPRLALHLSSISDDLSKTANFSREFHKFGVNMRHLSLVAKFCSKQQIKKLLLLQILTRTFKNIFREVLRIRCKSIFDLKNILVGKANWIMAHISNGKQSSYFFDQVRLRFGQKAVDLMSVFECDLGALCVQSVLDALYLCGVVISEHSLALLRSQTSNEFFITSSEILGFFSVVKRMPDLDFWTGKTHSFVADRLLKSGLFSRSAVIRQLALSSFQNATSKDPDNEKLLLCASEEDMCFVFSSDEFSRKLEACAKHLSTIDLYGINNFKFWDIISLCFVSQFSKDSYKISDSIPLRNTFSQVPDSSNIDRITKAFLFIFFHDSNQNLFSKMDNEEFWKQINPDCDLILSILERRFEFYAFFKIQFNQYLYESAENHRALDGKLLGYAPSLLKNQKYLSYIVKIHSSLAEIEKLLQSIDPRLRLVIRDPKQLLQFLIPVQFLNYPSKESIGSITYAFILQIWSLWAAKFNLEIPKFPNHHQYTSSGGILLAPDADIMNMSNSYDSLKFAAHINIIGPGTLFWNRISKILVFEFSRSNLSEILPFVKVFLKTSQRTLLEKGFQDKSDSKDLLQIRLDVPNLNPEEQLSLEITFKGYPVNNSPYQLYALNSFPNFGFNLFQLEEIEDLKLNSSSLTSCQQGKLFALQNNIELENGAPCSKFCIQVFEITGLKVKNTFQLEIVDQAVVFVNCFCVSENYIFVAISYRGIYVYSRNGEYLFKFPFESYVQITSIIENSGKVYASIQSMGIVELNPANKILESPILRANIDTQSFESFCLSNDSLYYTGYEFDSFKSYIVLFQKSLDGSPSLQKHLIRESAKSGDMSDISMRYKLIQHPNPQFSLIFDSRENILFVYLTENFKLVKQISVLEYFEIFSIGLVHVSFHSFSDCLVCIASQSKTKCIIFK